MAKSTKNIAPTVKAAAPLAGPPAAPAAAGDLWVNNFFGGYLMSGQILPDIVPRGNLTVHGFNESTTGAVYPSAGPVGIAATGGTWSNDNPTLATYTPIGVVGGFDEYNIQSIIGHTGTVHITYSKPGFTPRTIVFTIVT